MAHAERQRERERSGSVRETSGDAFASGEPSPDRASRAGADASANAPGAQQDSVHENGAHQNGAHQNGDRPDLATAVAAAETLLRSSRDFLKSWLNLLHSEWRLARAALPVAICIIVLLVGLAMSLWASLIMLAGWGLYVATGSITWTLCLLVGAHVVLLTLGWFGLKRFVHTMTLSESRAELSAMMNRIVSPGERS